jgi:protein involved in ribonucleotide reduction
MIVFASRTGNVRSIVDKLHLPSLEIVLDLVVNQPYFLLTYTDGLGDVPEFVSTFLEYRENRKYLKGVIASGNINFGESFCKSADVISEKYHVPVIQRIDLRGTDEDLFLIKSQYNQYIGVNE